MYGIQQGLVINGLAKVSRSAGCEGPIAGLGGVMSGNNHRRDAIIVFSELGENGKSVDLGHVQVQDDAVGAASFQRFKKIRPRGEGFHLEAGGAQKPPEGGADGFLVIDDGDGESGDWHRVER